MELIDSVGLICIDMEKAKVLLEEIQSEYLTGAPMADLDAVQIEDLKERLAAEFNRYSTIADILQDYLGNIDEGLNKLRGELEEVKKQGGSNP